MSEVRITQSLHHTNSNNKSGGLVLFKFRGWRTVFHHSSLPASHQTRRSHVEVVTLFGPVGFQSLPSEVIFVVFESMLCFLIFFRGVLKLHVVTFTFSFKYHISVLFEWGLNRRREVFWLFVKMLDIVVY